MLKNYFRIAIRNFVRHKVFSFINILGLTIGITCFILIFLWIRDELSYDKFNQHYDRIYRIGTDIKAGEMEDWGISTTPPLGPAIMNEIPEIESAVRLVSTVNKLVSARDGEVNFLENRIYYADSTVFDVFTIPLIQGDPQELLTRKNTIVITQSTAEKYFGDTDPVGEKLSFDNSWEFEVTGVIGDCPNNSHWHYDMLASMISIKRSSSTDWLSSNLFTYIKLTEEADPVLTREKVNQLFLRNADPIFQQYLGISISEWEKAGNHYYLRMVPLREIYLFSDESEAVGVKGDIRYIYLFTVIGFFILLIACINFMNLNTARASARAKEIGIRKVLGSYRIQLVRQFLLEAVLISVVAMTIALLIVKLTLPYFNAFTEKKLQLGFTGFYSIPFYLLLTLGIGLMAGSYSAISLSSFKIVNIIKGNLFQSKNKSWFRNLLVLFQFSISILVIICTIIALNQMSYIKDKKLGFDKDQLLIIDRAYILDEQLPVFKEEILKSTRIISASATFCVPGTSMDGGVYNKENSPPEDLYFFQRICGDYDYLETMGIKILSGRYFSPDIASDETAILINEAGASSLGFDDPIGKKIIDPDSQNELTIIGVFRNYHLTSLHEEICPAFMHHPNVYWKHYLAIRFQPEDLAGTLAKLESEWQKFTGNQPFEYFFMDEYFAQLHRSEQITGYFFAIFASLAVFIACLGLFGLATFTAEQKNKEIGVRKVLGASAGSIVLILLGQFIRWVLIANIIAWPLAYLVMKNWLGNFAYHINMNAFHFISAGLLTLFISVLTVSYLSYRSASANPVETLKYE